MVPALKEAATQLKADGIAVAAIDGQMSPQVAQHLGVRAYPTIQWLKREGDALAVAPYQGARDTESFVRFARAAHKAGSLKSKLGQSEKVQEAAEGSDAAEGTPKAEAAAPAGEEATAKSKSKLGQSKVGASGGSVGVQKAKMPAEAEAEPPADGKEAPATEAAPAAAAA